MNYFSSSKFVGLLLTLLIQPAIGTFEIDDCLGIEQKVMGKIETDGRSLGFSSFLLQAAPIFFDQDTKLSFPQGGGYVGPDGIGEYAAFFGEGVASPFIAENDALNQTFSSFELANAEDGICTFLIFFASKYQMAPELTTGHTVNNAQMAKAVYSLADDKITNIYVYYTPEWLDWAFRVALGGENSKEFFCDAMAGCPDIHQRNGSPSRQDCIQQFAELPVAEGDLKYLDGNSQGCRYMHVSFAYRNPDHCAHISFVEAEDPHGLIKCQESKETAIDTLFTSQDLAAFEHFCTEQATWASPDCYLVTDGPELTSGAIVNSGYLGPIISFLASMVVALYVSAL